MESRSDKRKVNRSDRLALLRQAMAAAEMLSNAGVPSLVVLPKDMTTEELAIVRGVAK